MLSAIATPTLLFDNATHRAPDCRKDGGLPGVWDKPRLKVKNVCTWAKGTVIAWRYEHDGDVHVSMKMDGPGWVNAYNRARQHGWTVVEFTPLGPHVRLQVRQRLKLLGTRVLDLQHGDHKTSGWIEMHPVVRIIVLRHGTRRRNNPALAPRTEPEK